MVPAPESRIRGFDQNGALICLQCESQTLREVVLEQRLNTDRRSFLTHAGLGGGVLALGPLAASIAASAPAAAAPMKGKFDFDTPYNRLGTDSVKWDMPVRVNHMSRIVAGMTTADMDFKCAPSIMAALRKRMQ